MRRLSSEARYLDVRSEGEFATGAMPGSTNLPILTNAQRIEVGTCYSKRGRRAAIELGEALVSGEIKSERIATWVEFARRHPKAMICCARGGMRSEYAQRWLRECGIDLERVPGGYKALRSLCLGVLESHPASLSPILLGGRTGSGKTQLLHEYQHAIDLEGLANHRGSAFGATETPQPSQATMENHLAHRLCEFSAGQRLLLEDESRAIGSRSIPTSLYEVMSKAPIVVLELDRQARAERIFDEYVANAMDSTTPEGLHHKYSDALKRIRKRLGGLNHDKIAAELDRAFATESHEAHLEWIASLLQDYYDPLYDHGLKRKQKRIRFRGSPQAAREWLREQFEASANNSEAKPKLTPFDGEPRSCEARCGAPLRKGRKG